MYILQIEHKVSSFDDWKKVFDSDPIQREKAGVKRYQIYRPENDLNTVIIDLEFDDSNKAHAVLEALRKVWSNVQGNVIFNPQTRILDVIETKVF